MNFYIIVESGSMTTPRVDTGWCRAIAALAALVFVVFGVLAVLPWHALRHVDGLAPAAGYHLAAHSAACAGRPS
jgi:hypothetical protein